MLLEPCVLTSDVGMLELLLAGAACTVLTLMRGLALPVVILLCPHAFLKDCLVDKVLKCWKVVSDQPLLQS